MPDKIAEKLKNLPQEPGVYLMKDSSDKIIYVGKAKSLKSRVSSYFQNSKHHSLKTLALVEKIRSFDVMLVDSEVSALLLERTLIKHHSPVFNIMLRDDKEYPYVRIDLNSDWPRIRKVRQRKDDGATYLGPFGNAGYLNTMLQMVGRIFPTIKCSRYEFQNAKRPCNYFHMGQCLAPCMNGKKSKRGSKNSDSNKVSETNIEVTREEYLATIKDATSFLQGRNRDLIRTLTEKMKKASQEENYEQAGNYRDQLAAFKGATQKQSAVIGSIKDADVIGFVQEEMMASVHVILIREGYMSGQDNFVIKTPVQTPEEAITEFLLQYYDNKFVPGEIYLPIEIEDREVLEETLISVIDSKMKLKISIPQKGDKKKLIEIAEKNANYVLQESLRQKQTESAGLKILQEILELDSIPKRIECIDISNIQGTAIVASDVCFINGKPAKELYRLYNINDVADGPDDFGSIREVVKRRLARAVKDNDLPDLLVIDGGKGQLSAALDSVKEYPELSVNLVSLAKSRLDKTINDGKNELNSRIVHSKERIFRTNSDRPIELEVGSPEYRIMTQIRDEAHRFAITHHRRRRKKILHGSILEEIPGIGPVIRKKLFEKFKDLDGMKRASLDEFKAVKGLKDSASLALFAHFRSQEE